jgi:hypothetical protein
MEFKNAGIVNQTPTRIEKEDMQRTSPLKIE